MAWLALVPLFFVLRAYVGLARETGSTGLRKSGQCLFGAILLSNVWDLATLQTMPTGWQIAWWIIFGIGMLALLSAPFVVGSETRDAPAKAPTPAAAEEASPAATRRTGAIVAVIAGLFVVFKLAAKGILVKLLLFRGVARWLRQFDGGWELMAGGLLLLLWAAFLLWFGIAKLRLRGRLGALAGLLGWLEILIVVFVMTSLTWLLVSLFSMLGQPGVDEKAVESFVERAEQIGLLVSMGVALLWGSLTAFLFAAVRSRFPAEGQ